MDPPPIADLAVRAAQGDAAAFDALIRTQLDRLRGHVQRRLGQRVRARIECEDVVQETVLKACTAIHNFVWTGEGPFFRWLARIAEHVIWKASQKMDVPRLTLEPVAPGEPTPSTRSARQERAERLERAIADLSEDHRRVVRWTRLDGRPIAEVAELMNRSPNAVKKLLARALDELRRRYGASTGSLLIVRPDRPDGESSHD